MNKIIRVIFLFIIISNSYALDKKNVLIIDTGIDITHDKIKKFNINQQNFKITNDHGSHLFCILTKGLNPNNYVFTSINYKKQNINNIINLVKNIKFDFVLFASNGEIYQTKEEVLLKQIVSNNQNVKIITSSGNKSLDLDNKKMFPCSYDIKQITCIGNYQKYSNYGRKVKKIRSPIRFESCSLNNNYIIKYGTSQSAAFYLNKLLTK